MKLFLFAILALVVAAALPVSASAVSMGFTGNFRGEASHYGKLGLVDTNPTKSYLSARALLTPNLVIDDHFSIKSQWSLLTSPSFTPNATNPLGVGQGGYIFGDVSTPASLTLSRAWLEWTSDFGVLRAGRMPVSWGYGLLWDSGNGVWDDFQTTLDRVEYRLHLGHVIGALAYSKPRKLSTIGNDNDQDFYTVYLQYDNPELEVEGGVLYEKQGRSASQQADLMSSPKSVGSSNPYQLPDGTTNGYPLSKKTPYPLSNNAIDVYLKKTVGYFTFGGEIGWLNGTAVNYDGDNTPDTLNALGVMLNATYEYHTVKAFLDFLYASGDNNLNGDHLNGFVLLHRNRRPGLILGRELLGAYYGNTAGQGTPVAYGNPDSFSGVMYLRPGLRLDWSEAWSSGLELVIAQKAAVQAGEARSLGVEADLGTEYAVYKNFDLGLNLGYLFAGDGLGVPNPKGVFAVRGTASLKF